MGPLSPTYCHCVDPLWPICMHELRGSCRVAACGGQHWADGQLLAGEASREVQDLLQRQGAQQPELLVSRLRAAAARGGAGGGAWTQQLVVAWQGGLPGLDYRGLRPAPPLLAGRGAAPPPTHAPVPEQRRAPPPPRRNLPPLRYFSAASDDDRQREEGQQQQQQQQQAQEEHERGERPGDAASGRGGGGAPVEGPGDVDARFEARRAAEGGSADFWVEWALAHLDCDAAGAQPQQQQQQQQQQQEAGADDEVDAAERAMQAVGPGFAAMRNDPKLWLLALSVMLRATGFGAAPAAACWRAVQHAPRCHQLCGRRGWR
ncbi:hypothetical protein MNEG_11451 [Monoraphidium neglectum]|uniref:Uncharacterized protein n=1 Tax=Monoraphidium neglectum TaxID=145388 RepID=A0A0D2LYN2_9CHLO|nr:hypothetical protein MNEG_11451 [Monoraphidium neglectum]KIY96509.1 hypothetical protein MNEG_11451 [Monoraphidium neglectum]|eukprot:XP_013895529.1 hypothetical protein MNEG_11451 [Monoraphidium neglectum]